jgi:hypothetical protein
VRLDEVRHFGGRNVERILLVVTHVPLLLSSGSGIKGGAGFSPGQQPNADCLDLILRDHKASFSGRRPDIGVRAVFSKDSKGMDVIRVERIAVGAAPLLLEKMRGPEAVLAYLATNPGETTKQIAAGINQKSDSVGVWLSQLKRKGRVVSSATAGRNAPHAWKLATP